MLTRISTTELNGFFLYSVKFGYYIQDETVLNSNQVGDQGETFSLNFIPKNENQVLNTLYFVTL